MTSSTPYDTIEKKKKENKDMATVKIIREMEIPKTCSKCEYFRKLEPDFPNCCKITHKDIHYKSNTRDKKCPLTHPFR